MNGLIVLTCLFGLTRDFLAQGIIVSDAMAAQASHYRVLVRYPSPLKSLDFMYVLIETITNSG